MLPETLSRQKSKQVYESYDKFSLAGSKDIINNIQEMLFKEI